MENNQENETINLPDVSEFVGLKKKKKKVKFNFDELDGKIKSAPAVTDSPLSPINTNEITVSQESDLSFDLTKKKKKKKTIINDMTFADDDQGKPVISKSPDSLDLPQEADLNFDLTKKKKKKTKVHDMTFADEVKEKPVISKSTDSSDVWTDNTAEYQYEDLLFRIYGIMREKDPNRDLDCKKKLVMKPPQVIRIGTKKSSFINFLDICKMLHRTPQHLQSFLLVELGTSGSIDGNNQLIIKGRFEQRQIETVLRHYIKEYVTCHTCRSPDTFLQKDTRLFFLQCESCGSRCSVATIKSGFQAVTSKRAAIRAKAK